jgi:hypothetical protein
MAAAAAEAARRARGGRCGGGGGWIWPGPEEEAADRDLGMGGSGSGGGGGGGGAERLNDDVGRLFPSVLRFGVFCCSLAKKWVVLGRQMGFEPNLRKKNSEPF